MLVTIIVVFAILLAIFCVVGILAPRYVVRFAHVEDEVLDAVVVFSNVDYSIVRDSQGKLYYLKKALGVDTKIVIRTPHFNIPENVPCEGLEDYSFTTAKYAVSEKSGVRAQVICRLNENVLLCRYGEKEIFVECSEENQMELTEKVEIPVSCYKSLDVVYTETEDALVVPFVRLHEEWSFPLCYQEA